MAIMSSEYYEKELQKVKDAYSAIVNTGGYGKGPYNAILTATAQSQQQNAYISSTTGQVVYTAKQVDKTLVDYTAEILLKNGDTIELEINTYEGEAFYSFSFQNDNFSVKDKYGSLHIINKAEYVSIKVLTLEGKMAQVEKSLNAGN